MLKVQHVSADGGKKRAKFELPAQFSERVAEGAMYHAVRAFLANQRQGTHSTKTRGEVSGGGQKPWRQKGTGRARQGTTRAAQWRGGGVVFGPRPRSYTVKLPRKVRQLARQSALNARASSDALLVIEDLQYAEPRTKQLRGLLDALGVGEQRVLVLTSTAKPAVYLSGRNLPNVHVMPYAESTAYEVLWAEVVIVEEGALAPAEGATTDA